MTGYRRSEDTIKKISYTASVMFAENGYTNTTVRDICAAAGVSLSRLNYHFKTKLDLALYIFKATLRDVNEAVNRRLAAENEGLVKSVAYIIIWMGIFLAERKYSKFCADLVDEGVFEDLISGLFDELFTQAESDVMIGRVNIDAANGRFLFISSFASLIRAEANGRFDKSAEEFTDIFAYFFMMLLGVPSAEQKKVLADAKKL